MQTLRVPGDKSISHRALMLAALGRGRSRVRGLLSSADIESTARVLHALGVEIPPLGGTRAARGGKGSDGDELVIEGVGLHGLQPPERALDCGNSGTTARLMAGVLAASPFTSRLTGDASLSARPMRRVAEPLAAMGASLEPAPHGGLPMSITGGALRGLTWRSEIASAQVKSAILLAGVVGDVPVEIHETAATRDHTERMLRARGVDVRSEGLIVTLVPAARLDAADTVVPGDASSAAFLAALAALGGAGGGVRIENVGVNPGRAGAFRALKRMGAALSYEDQLEQGGEPVATIVVGGPSQLRGITVTADEVPNLIDELPLLACVAARAAGETRITGAAELRVKESDRIAAIVAGLRAIGATAEELPDGFVVQGSDRPLKGHVITHGDHRIAMAFGVLGALPGNAITLDDPSCVGVSYPNFWDDLSRLR